MDRSDRAEFDATDAAASVPRPAARSVGRYEILQEIGRGGMGVVYKAHQPDLDRPVALKELHSIHAGTPEIAQRFVRESRLAGSLNHPNIVTVYDYVEQDGASFIAMEYMPRGSLRSWVGELSLAQLAGVLEGLLAGLAAVEPSGIVHRDLKPENVMVAADGRVKITDFGIAKATQSAGVASFMTATGTTVGTPAYMAPEQALGHTIGAWTDLYSVGVMTYEQLVGRLPFHDSPTPVAILLRHVNEQIPPVIEDSPDVDRSLSEWVSRLLVKEPAERTSSAVQAWEELEEILLEQLGPRWRREARLPELGSRTTSPKPLTPAPFEGQSVKAPATSSSPPAPSSPPPISAKPEAESGFLSYGRAPTGLERRESSPAAHEPSSESLPGGAQRQQPQPISPGPNLASRSISIDHESLDQDAPAGPRRLAAPSTRRTRPGSTRARRLGTMAFLVALMGVAGFALAATDEGGRASTRGGASPATLSQGPSRAYAIWLSDAMSKLNTVRADAGAQLSRATTARTQAEAAGTLAHAHEQAATALGRATPGPSERATNAAIVAALVGIGKGYATMARAARNEDRHGFEGARRTVIKETDALMAALARLPALGYKLAS
jgi:serine/threonine protein kinase